MTTVKLFRLEQILEDMLWKDIYQVLKYTWRTDKIEITDDNITIFRNDKIIYKIDVAKQISYCKVEEVFYKQ